MSSGSLRQRTVWLAGAAAIMPIVTFALPAVPTYAGESSSFRPPLDTMLLTRTFRRPLPGGAEVKTQRSYEIHFVSEGDGFRIDGELVESVVDAPPALQALAALERSRPDTGMFPMRLDVRGKLLPKDEPPTSMATQQAGKLAAQQIDEFSLPAAQAREAREFVEQVKGRTGRTPWPQDLFNPAPGQRQHVQTIPLPNGAQGQVSIEIDARTDEPSGLLATFERTVTTELGSDARVTQETWTLSVKS